jgi:hypothetical protein
MRVVLCIYIAAKQKYSNMLDRGNLRLAKHSFRINIFGGIFCEQASFKLPRCLAADKDPSCGQLRGGGGGGQGNYKIKKTSRKSFLILKHLVHDNKKNSRG